MNAGIKYIQSNENHVKHLGWNVLKILCIKAVY